MIIRFLAAFLTLFAAGSAQAHHTYSHQAADPFRLFATAEMFILAKQLSETKLCVFLFPRVKETRQYGIRTDNLTQCPKDVWLDIGRSGDGTYTITPVAGSTPADFLDKALVLTPQKGPDTAAVRAKFAVAGLTPAMTREEIATALKAKGDLQFFEVEPSVKTKKPIDTTLFSALVAGAEEYIDRESIVVITHKTGADGHYTSQADSIVAIQHLKQTLIEEGSDPMETVNALKARYGEPSLYETEKWSGTEVLSEIDMVWAVNDDGSIERDYDRFAKCGPTELAMVRAEVRNPAIEGSRGRMSLQMEHHEMFGGRPIIGPGPCVLFLRVTLDVGSNGKMYKSRTTLTDAGLLTDIYNKNRFDTGKAYLPKIKRPKSP